MVVLARSEQVWGPGLQSSGSRVWHTICNDDGGPEKLVVLGCRA